MKLIDSRVTRSDIGTKFIRAMNHTPMLKKPFSIMFVSLLFWKGKRYQSSFPLYSVQTVIMEEPTQANASWINMVKNTK